MWLAAGHKSQSSLCCGVQYTRVNPCLYFQTLIKHYNNQYLSQCVFLSADGVRGGSSQPILHVCIWRITWDTTPLLTLLLARGPATHLEALEVNTECPWVRLVSMEWEVRPTVPLEVYPTVHHASLLPPTSDTRACAWPPRDQRTTLLDTSTPRHGTRPLIRSSRVQRLARFFPDRSPVPPSLPRFRDAKRSDVVLGGLYSPLHTSRKQANRQTPTFKKRGCIYSALAHVILYINASVSLIHSMNTADICSHSPGASAVSSHSHFFIQHSSGIASAWL